MDRIDIKRLAQSCGISHASVYREVMGSTNEEAKLLAAAGAPEWTLVTCDDQNAGKGRLGRSWQGIPGENIAMSIILRPGVPISSMSMLTIVAALAVRDALEKAGDVLPGIKWPNDIIYRGKKLCGILTESVATGEYAVLGIGVNVHNRAFPEELKEKAASLDMVSGKVNDRTLVMEEILKALKEYYEAFLRTGDLSELVEIYNKNCVNAGAKVRLSSYNNPGECKSGMGFGINRMGELLVRWDDGTEEAVYAGEVSVRGVYGQE